jgi:MFS transporter, DHA2 family, methylenomycin A resistance protein
MVESEDLHEITVLRGVLIGLGGVWHRVASHAATSRGKPTAATRAHGLGVAVTVATSLGFFLVQLDVSIVNVALATIGRDLHTGFAALQWVVDAYAVAFAACLLSAGAIADRIGARRAFVIGLVLFGCSSVACGFAPSAALLIGARAVQGIGAALLVPCSLALLNHAAEGDAGARARAVSLWTASGSVALAAGPIIGGVLVAGVGWRSIFYVNVPLVALAIWLTLRSVTETTPRKSALDVPGQLCAVVMLGTLTAAVITAGSIGWSAPLVLALFAAAIASSAGFAYLESRDTDVMLPLNLFMRRPFTVATIVGFVVNFTLYGALFELGLYLQRLHGYSPLQTGLAFLPFCVVIGLANLAAGRITAARGPRLPMVLGLALAAIGFVALTPLDTHTAYAGMLLGLIVTPLGIGLAVPAMTTALLASVEKERSGLASGVLNSVRQSGGALGVAVLGGLLAAHQTFGMRISFVAAAVLLAAVAGVAMTLKTPARSG